MKKLTQHLADLPKISPKPKIISSTSVGNLEKNKEDCQTRCRHCMVPDHIPNEAGDGHRVCISRSRSNDITRKTLQDVLIAMCKTALGRGIPTAARPRAEPNITRHDEFQGHRHDPSGVTEGRSTAQGSLSVLRGRGS